MIVTMERSLTDRGAEMNTPQQKDYQSPSILSIDAATLTELLGPAMAGSSGGGPPGGIPPGQIGKSKT
jgi:hypothetical protein